MYVYTTTTPKPTPSFIPKFHLHRSLPNPNSTYSHQVIKRCNRFAVLRCSNASISQQNGGTYDPELNYVLQLATGSELYELKQILFGKSYFSPLLKSIARPKDIDYLMVEQDPDERDDFIAMLESRFFFLAADARSTLRGWRPSYRNVLLGVRKKLKIPCSAKLKTEDLEVEIFLHLLQEYSSDEAGRLTKSMTPDGQGSLELGLSQWKIQSVSALRAGTLGLRSMILKGGGILTLGKLYKMLARGISGKLFLEAANYQIKNEVLRKGGHMAAINLESRAALLAAKQGVTGAASRYIGLRSMMTLFGPIFLLSKDVIAFMEHFISLMLSFRCLEQIMLESSEPFMQLRRFGLHVHMNCHLIPADLSSKVCLSCGTEFIVSMGLSFDSTKGVLRTYILALVFIMVFSIFASFYQGWTVYSSTKYIR